MLRTAITGEGEYWNSLAVCTLYWIERDQTRHRGRWPGDRLLFGRTYAIAYVRAVMRIIYAVHVLVASAQGLVTITCHVPIEHMC